MNEAEELIINMSYSYFSTHPVTPDSIRAYIKQAKNFSTSPIDEVELFRKLDAVHSVYIEGEAQILESGEGHEG